MAKNYIEHEVKVQFMEQYFSKGTEWQWFIDRIEKDFDFEDISNWNEYESLCGRLLQLYSLFEKLVEVGSTSLSINQPMLMDIYIIANFRLGASAVKRVIENITTVFGKTFFLVVWTTALEKQDNNIRCLCDNDIFILRNMWQSRNMISIELYGDDLISYGMSIPMTDIEAHIACLRDNISKVYYETQQEFVNELEKMYSINNLFGYQRKQVKVSSWQEQIIVALINNGPNRDNGKYPIENVFRDDFSKDISNQLKELKKIFSSKLVDFVIETVLFLWIYEEPSIDTKCKYFDIWKQSFETEEHFCYGGNCGFWCISLLFAKGFTSDIIDSAEFIDFLSTLHKIKDVYDLQKLMDAKFPLSREQKNILKVYQETAYRKIDDINNPHFLEEYMRNDIVCKSIDTVYFCKVREKFVSYLNDDSIQRLLPTYFYEYMVFLIKTKNMSTNVNKKEIDVTIIRIQKIWENQYYSIACQSLQTFNTKKEISGEEIDIYNREVLRNPFLLAKVCMTLDEKSVCDIMEHASEHAISYLISRMELSKTYPVKNEEINLVRHDVDVYLSEFIGKIKQEKGYRFLNQLDNNKYLMALYEDIHLRSRMCISLFYKEQIIYEQLMKKSDIQLLTYTDELLLAHVTQLFPVLEQKIRDVSSIFGVVPFKEDLNSFMQFKDPSSLLREMIEEAYKETGNFELIYDLMFVYSFMYNSNSFNIRNECIHGRGYNTPSEIQFAFKVTLLSIYMIEYRIDLVTNNSER